MIALLVAIISLTLCGPAQAQSGWNRVAGAVSVLHVEGGQNSRIHAFWKIELLEPASFPWDLSSFVQVLINGNPVGVESHVISIDPVPGVACPQTPPSCFNSEPCGSGTDNGIGFYTWCHQVCAPGGVNCECHCGVWFSIETDEVQVGAGDLVSLMVSPMSGALPEQDTSDDVLSVVYDGRDILWNRGIREAILRPTPGGLFSLEVHGSTGSAGLPGPFLPMDFMLEVRVNGVVFDERLVVNNIGDSGGAPHESGYCEPAACVPDCPLVNGFPGVCVSLLTGDDCYCGVDWTKVIDDLEIDPGTDGVEVELIPVPGALPELPGLDQDDEAVPDEAAAVGEISPRSGIRLANSRPNPVSAGGQTQIAFQLDRTAQVEIVVFDASGRRVRTVVDEQLGAGAYSRAWDGRNDHGRLVPSGAYIYRMKAGGEEMSRKVLVVE